mmetsp:Transcript_3176/g.7128  ORF Transcript_3176/g.7128 Transcript_3176/m.7128 type:complete len:258 (+) Transcript_3176:94-867(+)
MSLLMLRKLLQALNPALNSRVLGEVEEGKVVACTLTKILVAGDICKGKGVTNKKVRRAKLVIHNLAGILSLADVPLDFHLVKLNIWPEVRSKDTKGKDARVVVMPMKPLLNLGTLHNILRGVKILESVLFRNVRQDGVGLPENHSIFCILNGRNIACRHLSEVRGASRSEWFFILRARHCLYHFIRDFLHRKKPHNRASRLAASDAVKLEHLEQEQAALLQESLPPNFSTSGCFPLNELPRWTKRGGHEPQYLRLLL